MLNSMIKNFVIEEKGYRYDIIVRQFAASLYILGGRTAYEFIRLNIPAFLPSVQVIQSYINTSENHLTEGLFNYDGVRDYFNANQSTIGFCAEDCTAIIPKITYDTKSNTFVGCSLPLDNNGIPITNSYSTDSFTDLEQWCSDLPQAKSINACLIQPLSLSINHISPYLLAAFGTDNKFKSSNIILRWHHIYEECKLKGIRIIGYATDCDSRYLRCMRISLGFFGHFAYVDHPDNLKIDLPKTWSCVTDNQLTGTGAYLLLGDQLINMEPLFFIIDQISKLEHTLVPSDINPKDRQNYKSCTKISSDEVLNILEQVPIPNSIGISIYLKASRRKRFKVDESELHHNILMKKHDLDLIFTQLSGLTISDKKKNDTKRKYFITYQSFFSVEINAHCLVYLAVLVSEGQLPPEALLIWLQNSQTCENTFRSARSISSVNSAGVNFTVSQFLSQINKLSTLQNIKDNTHENKLHFPQHHKVSSTLRNASNSSNITIISKTDIENTVLNAYKYVSNLFKPLKIKHLLRNGQTIPIKELSVAI
ncbi:unnamed protein product, partial [Rotaria sp. Silwood2]